MGLYKRLTECLPPLEKHPPRPFFWRWGGKFICASWSSGQVFVFDQKEGEFCAEGEQ